MKKPFDRFHADGTPSGSRLGDEAFDVLRAAQWQILDGTSPPNPMQF